MLTQPQEENGPDLAKSNQTKVHWINEVLKFLHIELFVRPFAHFKKFPQEGEAIFLVPLHPCDPPKAPWTRSKLRKSIVLN